MKVVDHDEHKPTQHVYKSYLQAIHNAVGSNLFRNYYVSTPERGEFDALGDGDDSCAFFVSSLVLMFGKIASAHATVGSTVKDLETSGWTKLFCQEPQAGDVLVWEPLAGVDDPAEHIGFSIGDGRAVSNSSTHKTPVEHDVHFGDAKRALRAIYHMPNWG